MYNIGLHACIFATWCLYIVTKFLFSPLHRHVLWKKRTETLKLLFYTEVQYGCTQSFFLPLIKLHCFHVCLHPLFN